MNSECLRIADQLTRAFTGDPWHGSPLREILSGITPAAAAAHPLSGAHSIWKLLYHIDLYLSLGIDATQGHAMPKLYEAGLDWKEIDDTSGPAWTALCDETIRNADHLATIVTGWTDAKLKDIVPGRDYDFYYLFHGLVQHSLYHGGQIAMLKKSLGSDH